MNMWGAIKELQEGKRIRQSHYVKGVYLYMDDDGYIRFNDGEKYRFMSGVNLDDDKWVIYEELEEETKYERKEVPNDLKKVYKSVGEFWGSDSYNSYGEYITETFEENYLLKLWNQLCRMNEYYKLDE